MNSYLRLLLFLLFGQTLPAQVVKTLVRNHAAPRSSFQAFVRLPADYAMNGLEPMGLLEGYFTLSGDLTVQNLYHGFRIRCAELGANVYRMDSTYSRPDTVFVRLTVYDCTETEAREIAQAWPDNMVYVFGELRGDAKKKRKVYLNDARVVLPPLHYVVCRNSPGREIKISYGGLAGMAVWIEGETGRGPAAYQPGKGTTSPAPGPVAGRGVGVGVSFTTGSLNQMESELAVFLDGILTPVPCP